MRILQVIPVFSDVFGGPVSVVRGISKELAKRHNVTVYTTTALDLKHDSDPREEEVNGYKVIYFPRALKPLCYSYLLGQLNTSSGMMNAVKKDLKEFDVIHLHSWRHFQDIIVHHYATKYHVPYVLQAHGSLPRIMAKQRLKWIYDMLFGYRLLRDAAKVIALSQVEAEQYKRMSVPEEKIAIIPNGIDLSDYASLPPKGSFKKKFNIPEDKKIVLYLGRIHKIKGIDFLVEAYANIVKDLKNCNSKLVIVGPDDGYLDELRALIKRLMIEKDVLITGPLYGTHKLEAYVDADVYVLPSRYETFPMGLLEAYACSKPVVASMVRGLKSLVIDGATGLLFEPGNTRQLAESILSLLRDDDQAEKIGMNGREFVEGNFSIEKIVDCLEDLYSEVVSNSTGSIADEQ